LFSETFRKQLGTRVSDWPKQINWLQLFIFPSIKKENIGFFPEAQTFPETSLTL